MKLRNKFIPKDKMGIEEIASNAKYRKGEQFQNLTFFFFFENLRNFDNLLVFEFYNSKIFLKFLYQNFFLQFTNLQNLLILKSLKIQKYQIWKIKNIGASDFKIYKKIKK